MRRMEKFLRRVITAFSSPRLALRRLLVGSAEFAKIQLDEIKPYLLGQGAIIEAGSSDGVDTIALARKFPKHTLYSLEPVKEQYLHVLQITGKLPNVKLFHAALSRKDGTTKLFVGRSSGSDISGMGSSSLLEPTRHIKEFTGIHFHEDQQEVETFSLSSFARKQDIELIDLLWLDIQGSEGAVLNASKKFVSIGVNTIHLEMSRIPLYKEAETAKVLHKLLKSLGFKRVINRIGSVSGNALYRNKRFDVPKG